MKLAVAIAAFGTLISFLLMSVDGTSGWQNDRRQDDRIAALETQVAQK